MIAFVVLDLVSSELAETSTGKSVSRVRVPLLDQSIYGSGHVT